jgi:hypothetical protein
VTVLLLIPSQSNKYSISIKQVPYPNLVTNGTFDTDSDWTKGTGWSIGSGVASCDGSQTTATSIYQADPLTENKWYLIRFYISAYTSGTVRFVSGQVVGDSQFDTGWKEAYALWTGSGTNFALQGSANFVGSIDNVIVQELPASIDRKYYLDTDGSDDWMEVKPTLNLGEQWWHVGAWQGDTPFRMMFATSSTFTFFSALNIANPPANGLRWADATGTFVSISGTSVATPSVITVEQHDTNSLSAKVNGISTVDSITPYDDSGSTQGLALFSANNSSFNSGIDGRFYGGSWGQGQVDYDELTVLQDYLGTTTQPPIDPPDGCCIV